MITKDEEFSSLHRTFFSKLFLKTSSCPTTNAKALIDSKNYSLAILFILFMHLFLLLDHFRPLFPFS